MAIALENANLVWQKAKAAMTGANPANQEALKDLKLYLASQKRNFNLQFIPYAAEDIIANGGYSPDVDGNRIYAIYAKVRRTGTGTTSAFFNVHAATDNSATTTTITTARFKAAGQEYLFIYPNGLACETELTLSSAQAVGGSTETTSADDANDGFVIIGAA
jgi:hypothetical protein